MKQTFKRGRPTRSDLFCAHRGTGGGGLLERPREASLPGREVRMRRERDERWMMFFAWKVGLTYCVRRGTGAGTSIGWILTGAGRLKRMRQEQGERWVMFFAWEMGLTYCVRCRTWAGMSIGTIWSAPWLQSQELFLSVECVVWSGGDRVKMRQGRRSCLGPMPHNVYLYVSLCG